MISESDVLFGEIMECLFNGVEPTFTTTELVEFKSAIDNLRKQFTVIEPNEYLLDRAAEEAEWDDEDDV